VEKAGRELLARLARQAPLLPGADVLAFIDIDSTQKPVYGHKKEGARFGHTKIQGKPVLVRGLGPLICAVSTPLAAPVAAATRLRGGNAPSARGAASLAAQAIGTARASGASGTIVVRMDSATTPPPSSPGPAAVGPGSPSPPRSPPRSGPRSPPSPKTPGPRSPTRTPAG